MILKMSINMESFDMESFDFVKTFQYLFLDLRPSKRFVSGLNFIVYIL